MHPRKIADLWLDGCRQLAAYDRIPGYRRLSWARRKRLDHLVLYMLVRSPSFWRGVFWVAVACGVMHVLTWRFDLQGAARDLLRVLPLVLAFPCLLAARKRCLLTLLGNRDLPHRHARPVQVKKTRN